METQLQTRQDGGTNAISREEHEHLQKGLHGQTKEVKILRKTVDEMELRLETQKQTLTARDESIKKLLEMLQSKGVAIEQIEETTKELEKCKVTLAADCKQITSLQKSVEEKGKEIVNLKEVGIIKNLK